MFTWLIPILEFRARRALLRHPNVKINPAAKVKFRDIRMHAGSCLEIGEGSIVEAGLVSEREGASIVIGRNTFVGVSLIASATRIEIGDDVLISWGCTIVDHNSHPIAWADRKEDVKNHYKNPNIKDWSRVTTKFIRIGNKAWVGLNVIILKGVEIGEGAVVGAGSVVTKDVPAWTVVAGNPARVIRELPIEER